MAPPSSSPKKGFKGEKEKVKLITLPSPSNSLPTYFPRTFDFHTSRFAFRVSPKEGGFRVRIRILGQPKSALLGEIYIYKWKQGRGGETKGGEKWRRREKGRGEEGGGGKWLRCTI